MYIDCGDDDFHYEGNSLVHMPKKKDVPPEYRVREGRHSWTILEESLPKFWGLFRGLHQY